MSINILLSLWCGGICLVTMMFAGVSISKPKEKFSSVNEEYKLLKNEFNKSKYEYEATLYELKKINKNLEELKSTCSDKIPQDENDYITPECRKSIIDDIKIIKKEIKRISKEASADIKELRNCLKMFLGGWKDAMGERMRQLFLR